METNQQDYQTNKDHSSMNKETIFSMMLAGAVVFGGIALMSKSIKPVTTHNPPAEKIDSTGQVDQYTPSQMKQEITPKPDAKKTGEINKCILGGKVVYSDTKCASGSKNAAIKIENSEGIVSPDRDTVNATMLRIIDENKRNREQNAPVMSLEIREKVSHFCESYKNQIEQLDAQARQRNSTYTLEKIRQTKRDIQKLQFDGNCYSK